MGWADFVGKDWTREQFVTRVAGLTWTPRSWSPQAPQMPVGIVLHNTAAPTLAQWAEEGPNHTARIRNLKNYFQNEQRWPGGPHLFISRNHITEFDGLLERGVHSPSYNASHFGIEMVGDYAREEFNSGDGAKVRDNAVFAMAVLCRKFGWDPGKVIKLHKEDPRTTHDCPGRKVVKAEVVNLVKIVMSKLAGQPPVVTSPAPVVTAPTAPVPVTPVTPGTRKVLFTVRGKMSTFGGPRDTGMKPNEGLALFQTAAEMGLHGLSTFLRPATNALPGLGRRLNPDKFYLACRWPAGRYPFLRDAVAWVSNPANGRSLPFRPVDWGPNARIGRVADLSPGGAAALGLDTDDDCTVTVYEDGR